MMRLMYGLVSKLTEGEVLCVEGCPLRVLEGRQVGELVSWADPGADHKTHVVFDITGDLPRGQYGIAPEVVKDTDGARRIVAFDVCNVATGDFIADLLPPNQAVQ